MLNKLMNFLGFDGVETTETMSLDNTLIEVRALQAENRELKEVIRKQRALLQELSEENTELGRDRRHYADTAATQKRLIAVYESMSV
ncbi:TPA: hypothetical protein U9K03_001471 [Streptococcus agalactiae]|nr:hypothetical protein [Streptococcus agalactiae]HEO4511333.1 hypothetical protein [Streptococcus agalactiae]HEO5201452.1 hypothetical protein [Streptococcus agalactiae]HEO6412486.1 hypothetical protein [Streptococcus agalactiae]